LIKKYFKEEVMITQEQVFEMIQKEAEYAAGWGKGTRKLSQVEGVSDADVHSLAPLAGQPYSMIDFMVFAKKYWDEAELAYANFTPDGGAVRIRILKVVSLLVRALQVHGRASDLERLAGVSSSKFPVIVGGLKAFDESSSAEGCLISTKETGALRNESPSCDPLKKRN
jgi:hypothetical protein